MHFSVRLYGALFYFRKGISMLESLYIFMIDETAVVDGNYFNEIIAPEINKMKDDFFRQKTVIVLPEANTDLRKMFTDTIKSMTWGYFPYLYSHNLKDYTLSGFRRLTDAYHLLADEEPSYNYAVSLITFIKNEDSEAFRQSEEFKKKIKNIISLV